MRMKYASFGLGLLLAMPALADEPAQTLPREEIEKIVREYLLREPEVIYQAIQELQKRREMAAAEQQQKMIVARKDDIFSNAADPVTNAGGDVTLVQFFDYKCGYCRGMAAGLQGLIAGDQKLRVVYKEFPVLGPDSVVAARAALAAAEQGQDKYEAFHNALMKTKDLSLDTIKATAAQVGLDVDRLVADMQKESIEQQLAANHALAQDLGISGTPSFVIGTKLIPGAIDIAQLEAIVAEERSATN
ncbi:MAG: DsbA family protein [Geminicoccaceae bacterium]